MTDGSVSRETATPPAPEQARGVFGERFAIAVTYAGLLAHDGVVRGLIGPREAPRLWERHLLNCAVLEEVIPRSVSVCDIGSGAGLPGLVLAIARPDVTVTLVEPLLRRTTFLEEAILALELDNVRVVRGRAEALHGVEEFDVVTSRAVAPLERLAKWSMPLVRSGGEMVALKGSSVRAEAEAAASVLADRGYSEPRVAEVGVGRVPEPTWVVRIAWSDRPSVSSPAAGSRDRETTSRSPRGQRRQGRSR